MPCCCQTNIQATFVLGILGLVFGGLSFVFHNYAGGVGIVASICFIVGAKSPNPTAILAGIILACIQCVGMIINAILLIVAGRLLQISNQFLSQSGHQNQHLNAILDQHAANIGAAQVPFGVCLYFGVFWSIWSIVGVVYAIGVIMFQIWTIIVANKARKEIDEGIRVQTYLQPPESHYNNEAFDNVYLSAGQH